MSDHEVMLWALVNGWRCSYMSGGVGARDCWVWQVRRSGVWDRHICAASKMDIPEIDSNTRELILACRRREVNPDRQGGDSPAYRLGYEDAIKGNPRRGINQLDRKDLKSYRSGFNDGRNEFDRQGCDQ